MDDDLSLEALTAALQSAQEKKTKIRLSERNVVELVLKLQQLGLLGSDLLYTVNGREYVTPERLRQEVADAVEQAGGRIALVDIPPLVNVDLVHVQRSADALVAAGAGSISLAQGELITSAYYDALAAEVDELLQEVGMVSLGDLARQFSLGTDLVTSTISARMGTVIHGKLDAGTLYTTAYLDRIKGQVRGALRAALEPAPLSDVAKELQLVSLGSGGGLVSGIVEELIKAGELQGHVRSGGIWTPSVFAAAQEEGIASFYSTNNYVSYTSVSRAAISGAPKDYLSKRFPDGLVLGSVFAAPALLQELDACAEEAAMNGSWCDVTSVAPPALDAADVAALLERCPAAKAAATSQSGRVMAGTCFVSAAFLEQLREKLLALAREAADEAVKRRRASGAAASTRGGGAGGAAAQETKQTAQAAAASGKGGDDSDDDWDRGAKKGKKGKGKKPPPKAGKGSSGGGGGGNAKSSAGAASSSAEDAAALRVLSLDGIASQLVEWEPDLEGAGDDGALPTALGEALRPGAVSEYESCLQRIFTAGADARRRLADVAAKSAEEAMHRFQLYAHGLEVAAADETTQQMLARHLLRSVGGEATQWLLRYMEAMSSEDLGSKPTAEAEAALRAPLEPAARAGLIKALPADLAAAAQRLVDALNGADAAAFQREAEASAQAVGMPLRLPDKKAERSLVHMTRKSLSAQLDAEADPAAALALLTPLLVARVHGRAVSVPGRSIGPVLALLAPGMEPGDHQLVAEFHQKVVASLKAQSGGGEGRAQAAALQEELLELLPRVKAVAGVGEAGAMGAGVDAADAE